MSMQEVLSFDDVLIVPKFSSIKSRADVDTSTELCGNKLKLGIIASNMDTVTGPEMARAMLDYGATAALHRFQSIEQNCAQFLESSWSNKENFKKPIVSIGLGKKELERAEALYSVGANVFLIDVAQGANIAVVEQVKELKKLLHHSAKIIVGNFATAKNIEDFNYHLGSKVDAYKISIGSGSACLTRVVTGCGLPLFHTILDCSRTGLPIIADGGIRNSGDFSKALAAGATAVMMGRLFAACDESPSEKVWKDNFGNLLTKIDAFPKKWDGTKYVVDESYEPLCTLPAYKKYRGSASTESYQVQGKVASHRSYEGDAYYIPATGPVKNTLQQFEGGLRSAMSYVGANNIAEFQEKAEFVRVTQGGAKESGAHGKSNG